MSITIHEMSIKLLCHVLNSIALTFSHWRKLEHVLSGPRHKVEEGRWPLSRPDALWDPGGGAKRSDSAHSSFAMEARETGVPSSSLESQLYWIRNSNLGNIVISLVLNLDYDSRSLLKSAGHCLGFWGWKSHFQHGEIREVKYWSKPLFPSTSPSS